MTRLGAERAAVQNPLVKYATEAGWTYVTREDAERMRRGESGVLLHDVFLAQAQKLSPGIVDGVRAAELAKRLERLPPRIDGNLEAWEYLTGLKTVFVPAEKRERNVCLLDEDDWTLNTFHVTDELSYTNGTHRIRVDVAFFVNGIPVLLVETKSAREIDGIAKALDQIRRYHREGPELLALMQAHTLTHLVRFHYGPTWNTASKSLFNWKEESAGKDFETLVKTFVHPQRITRVLADFILFTRKDDELSKVILRPHQMRAVERVVRRCADPDNTRGLIWHTQGSGKTFTMITAAKLVLDGEEFANPTVLMLVDRNELESQLFANLKDTGITHFEIALSKKHLRELLERDHRGLVISMIHKFEGVPADLNTRDSVFVLVDEAHRTTGGDLGNYLMGALPNATYIGFTGTPIDKTAYGKGTFKTFGGGDTKGYLDKYSIKESVEDGTTVPLNYTLAPSDLRVDRQVLEQEFFALAAAEGVSDIEELNKILEKAVTLRTMLKKPERISKVAAFVAKHFREVIEPMGYKAFVVGVDREACALYKQALDTLLPPELSRVVYSSAHNDSEQLATYRLNEDEEKRVRKAFTKPDQLPKILIVTEKLLTGFDAPILYCMYLDKPMRDHVLLQAIARVNRPYEDQDGRRKRAGFVLDFVGIFDNLEKALAFDSKDVEGVISDIAILKSEFTAEIAHAKEEYLSIGKGLRGDKETEAVLEHFRDEKVRQEFYQFFRHVSDLYEILSPDAFLRPHIDSYLRLLDTYRVVRSQYEAGIPTNRDLMRKTIALVQEYTDSSEIGKPLQVYEINEENLAKIGAASRSETVRVFNLLKSIQAKVDRDAGSAPYLVSIGERAEQVIAMFQSRQLSTKDTLEQLEECAKEITSAETDRADTKLPPQVFALFWLLKREGMDAPEAAAKSIGKSLDAFPHWRTSEAQERNVRRELYKVLVKADVPERKQKELAEHILKVLRRAE